MSTSNESRGKPNQGFLYGVRPWSAAIVAAFATSLIGGFAGYTSSEEGPPMSAPGHEQSGHEGRGRVRPMAIRVEAPDPYHPGGSLTEFLCEPVQLREPPPVEPPSVEARNPVVLRISWPSFDENRLEERDS
ncbi:MAG: hypothetical protein KAJ67_05545 [Gemmatimonadetes bacterium]|nr:hypothetical protein [Gemmatimonadota bacterium]